MTTLTEFLLARIAEDEAAALGARTERWEIREDRSRSADVWTELDSSEPHVAVGHDRVLAECEAKRRIVAEHALLVHALSGAFPDVCRMCVRPDGFGDGPTTPLLGQRYPCTTLRALALPYADHPDFRDEWRL